MQTLHAGSAIAPVPSRATWSRRAAAQRQPMRRPLRRRDGVCCGMRTQPATRRAQAAGGRPHTAATLQLECMLASTLPDQHSSCTHSTDPASHASPSMSRARCRVSRTPAGRRGRSTVDVFGDNSRQHSSCCARPPPISSSVPPNTSVRHTIRVVRERASMGDARACMHACSQRPLSPACPLTSWWQHSHQGIASGHAQELTPGHGAGRCEARGSCGCDRRLQCCTTSPHCVPAAVCCFVLLVFCSFAPLVGTQPLWFASSRKCCFCPRACCLGHEHPLRHRPEQCL